MPISDVTTIAAKNISTKNNNFHPPPGNAIKLESLLTIHSFIPHSQL